MAYRLKTVRYQNAERRILLQNENGPCPLLAVANALLLNDTIRLPVESIRTGVASLDDVVNVLAEKALESDSTHHHYLHELLDLFPKLQHGMDLNPKFTKGPTGVEYTHHLTAFDLLRIELVHGWLVDPVQEKELYDVIDHKTYNQVVELVIQGQHGAAATTDDPQEETDEQKTEKMQSSLLSMFLESTSHQLTQYGLEQLYSHLRDDQLCVFFRNNHFNTLTKHEGMLYLLVTDYGYATVPECVWEKLDVIDGDTEYVNADFVRLPPQAEFAVAATASPEALLAQRGQSEADYQLALELSGGSNSRTTTPPATSAAEQDMIAAATAQSLREYNNLPPTATIATEGILPQPDSDHMLAMQLQQQDISRDEELARALQQEENRREPPATTARNENSNNNRASSSGCIIS